MSKTRDVLPIGSTTFLRLQQSSDDQSHEFFFFFKPAGDPSSATLVPVLANQVWPFKSALFKTSWPGKRSWLTREASATERHGNDRLLHRQDVVLRGSTDDNCASVMSCPHLYTRAGRAGARDKLHGQPPWVYSRLRTRIEQLSSPGQACTWLHRNEFEACSRFAIAIDRHSAASFF